MTLLPVAVVAGPVGLVDLRHVDAPVDVDGVGDVVVAGVEVAAVVVVGAVDRHGPMRRSRPALKHGPT